MLTQVHNLAFKMQTIKPHGALLPSPGLGHLIPMLELGKRFVTNHNIHVTIFLVATHHTSNEQLSHLLNSSQDHHPNKLIDVISLSPVDISSLVDPNAPIVTKILVTMHESLPILRSTISSMKSRPTALIVDLFGTGAMAVADEFEMLKYVFFPSNARLLSVMVYAPTIDRKELDDHVFNKQPLKIPGCEPLRFEDTLEEFLDPNDPILRLGVDFPTADGILVNTCEDLESTTINALRDTNLLGRVVKAPVYPVGPLVRPVGRFLEPARNEILAWLDSQPNESVIYVSFGSGGTLSASQTIELAWGLELSQQRFIWVVRPPVENDVTGYFFEMNGSDNDPPNYLPDGFLTRTQKIGMVIPMWAPQAEILAHSSIGGFLSHCGWNSTLESIVNGLPMIAWPLYAEQKMNATLLTEELGVAVRSKELPAKNLIERNEVEMMVRRIMVDKEGHVMRKKVKELRCRGEKASSTGGSCYNSLSQVVKVLRTVKIESNV